MRKQYTYAVARIRALEVSLFTDSAVERLIACPTYDECLKFLAEHGWGGPDCADGAEEILAAEEEKTWKVMGELVDREDRNVFDVLSYPKLFHNLKAAIKDVCTQDEGKDIYYKGTSPSAQEMRALISAGNFEKLPANMQKAAAEAYEAMLHLRDGQLCDIIIDKAALDAIYAAGKASKEPAVRDYAEAAVAVADIKTAVRSARTGKPAEFMERALAGCDTINVEKLKKAALAGEKEICAYLAGTPYSEGAQALEKSLSAFDLWCDNRLIQAMQAQKYSAFTIGPVIAYAVARENEIKTVRIILTGKQNGFSDDSIRERVRKMYV